MGRQVILLGLLLMASVTIVGGCGPKDTDTATEAPTAHAAQVTPDNPQRHQKQPPGKQNTQGGAGM